MEYGLLGEKLGHSFSPQIHRDLAGYDYQLLPTPPEAVEDLFARRAFQGLNVTIPYKQTVMPLCDEVDPRAAAIGAVNTVVNRNGRLTGYNTDIDGFLYMARRAGVDMAGKKVVILGSGGTSRTARAAAGELGAREIVTVSRHGEDNYQNLSRHADAQVLVNTTPVGMYPNWGQSPVSLESFPALEGVLDVVYNPLRTALLLQAEERGLPRSCGLPMLVAQAKRAAELFTGQNIGDSRTEAVLHGLRRQLTSIVLIGMPGCGKTTVGRALAGKLGRTFVDLDEEIVRRAGTSIPEIFAREGEAGFRERESALVREFGERTGLVVSTGGGVVTRRENYIPLKQNGLLLHLRRDPAALPTDGRPLSQVTAPEELWRR
ncbi:MAG TPA: AAA family ATPase, partial [Candidatus Pelethomonas intestinigallinarum]|nr:AAA family ATPase [Candidatus Pelethomonas intestinigallinarum]